MISSVMPSRTELCGGMAHQGLKQHIDLSISRLSTYKALRDEIINYSRARRTWTDPNAVQVDAVHVNVNQEWQVDWSGSRSDQGQQRRQRQVQEGRQGQGLAGLTSCPVNCANDIPLLPRPANLSILSSATGGSADCVGQRQVGYRLENGEPFVLTWHVANVTNLIISTESLTVANMEVRHAKNESGRITNRCGTQTRVILHKFAKVPWLKLRRDNSVMDSDLEIVAVNTKPMTSRRLDSMKKDKHV